jgi:hypothetical protein
MIRDLQRRGIVTFLLCVIFIVHGCKIDGRASAFRENRIISQSEAELNSNSRNEKLILVIVDWDDFMCANCLESVLKFYHSLPVPFREEAVWGILIYDEMKMSKSPAMNLKIIEKKLRGFSSANGINIPFLIDRYHVFDDIAQEKTSVVVFNEKLVTVKRYSFPLTPNERDEVFQALFE